MKQKKILTGLILFVLGFAGILTMLTVDLPLPPEAKELLEEKFTMEQIKLLSLLNPTIFLLGAILLGVFFHQKVKLGAPVMNRLFSKDAPLQFGSILKFGLAGGLVAGVALTLIIYIYGLLIPEEFEQLNGSFQPTLAARFLYGGITEEILMRFGLMTFIVWLLSEMFRKLNPAIYWSGIVISALVFALGHFGVAFSSFEKPSLTLLSYVLIGNSIGGIIFGWLYWKKGLESSMLAHMVAHAVMVLLALWLY